MDSDNVRMNSENARMKPHNARMKPHNARMKPHNARMKPHNARMNSGNVPMKPGKRRTSPDNDPMKADNARRALGMPQPGRESAGSTWDISRRGEEHRRSPGGFGGRAASLAGSSGTSIAHSLPSQGRWILVDFLDGLLRRVGFRSDTGVTETGNPFFDHPILNSPYQNPKRHWQLDKEGQSTQRIVDERRKAEFISPKPVGALPRSSSTTL